ncbi:MAG: division/cell wall cluster transcriptional repressor MraZ [Asticcacaulis sp.]
MVPQEFRTIAQQPFSDIEVFSGVYCFALKSQSCLECGGPQFFDRYRRLIEAEPFASPKRRMLEQHIYGGMVRLNFDPAGRITLPEAVCASYGISDKVVLLGLSDRFQIWSPEAFEVEVTSKAPDKAALFAELGI